MKQVHACCLFLPSLPCFVYCCCDIKLSEQEHGENNVVHYKNIVHIFHQAQVSTSAIIAMVKFLI